MSLQSFIQEAVSPWMKNEGPESDIVISSRVRLARNERGIPFPMKADEEALNTVIHHAEMHFAKRSHRRFGQLELLKMADSGSNDRRMLVEKHLISPHLASEEEHSAVLLSEDESLSVMINEEDHYRIQCLMSGFQLDECLKYADAMDDWMEDKVDFAFHEGRGYLTSCPTNVGTGLRSSVMMHLPALVLTKQLNRIIPAINQLGLVVRGIYGEGSEALGNLFQVSNQTTLGKSEQEIVDDLKDVVKQLIQHERAARKTLHEQSNLYLEDRIYRSLGTLAYSRRMETGEAMQRLSDVRLGIDLGMISHIQGNILNELMVLTQPGFLQHYAEQELNTEERNTKRASFIRERLQLEKSNNQTNGGGQS
ncbi:protein arginine kinase [Salisediminibacterium beveridgei]|uniref:Protein-arginine kinase n=1 Tax=Salisediminibacterium beveridgei TaxID=632773 RepID=A0A1D7R004_9BACI|nr:protein arginine kinase [Salisediminibacterium beveridgei]AOM84593.1 Putative ATP:guanido phosphotransferase YacI [Salisediminibacterium beveridgei]